MTLPVFHGLATGYRVIVADPPWSFQGYTAATVPHRREEAPYPVLGLDSLKALPVASLAAPDAVLLLWTISSHLDQSFALGASWGFQYKARAFEWVKTAADGSPRMGMGHWTRQESESCLLFTRGRPKRRSKGVRSTIMAPIRGHSQKPDEQYDRIEALLDGPYCELFATRYRLGWDGWGNNYPSLGAAVRRLGEAWDVWATNLNPNSNRITETGQGLADGL